ncbi:immunity 52 family protein [Pyxidicoccus caerfyrddinensis]|uniref:immunity 52 family protein n=1 Tax=Pyxidicoccus caerfyrddinensis TaxID=2709663 RepID=UPI001F07D39D|nr:immunity 52 family protein [Pyxidicoccus caerfyrddinensis]
MNETHYAGVYWGARQEAPARCAERAAKLLASLPSVDGSLAHWFQQGKSRKDARKRPIDLTLPALEELIRRGKDRQFDDLGFSVAGWNGADDDQDACGFNFTCGSYSKWVQNACVFTLPARGPNSDRVLTAPALGGLLRIMASAWEPDWGVAMSDPLRERLKSRCAKGGPYVGWVTYLARRRGAVPPLPTPVSIESVEDKGTLIVLTPERFTVANPEHVALAERVHELLDRAGLLGPLNPSQPAAPTT